MLYKLINGFNILHLKQKYKFFKHSYTSLSDKSIEELLHIFHENRTSEKFNNRLFAAICLIAEAVYGIKLYKQQICCALALLDGYIVEMATGEGKTFATIIAAVYKALSQKVHVVTVNDSLAERDFRLCSKLADVFGLNLNINTETNNNIESKCMIYESDIVYMNTSTALFDYLREFTGGPFNGTQNVARDFIIIDEIDYVLLDNALTVCSLSVSGACLHDADSEYERLLFNTLNEFVKVCTRKLSYKTVDNSVDNVVDNQGLNVDYIVFKDTGNIYFTESGYEHLKSYLYIPSINKRLKEILYSVIYAHEIFKLDAEYIIHDNKIQYLNKNNGRIMPNCRIDSDLHTAIEVKEGIGRNSTGAPGVGMSYQVFYNLYKNITGLSGTVSDNYAEFEKIYGTPVLKLKPANNGQRYDLTKCIYKCKDDKFNAMYEAICNHREKQQPVIVFFRDEAELNDFTAFINIRFEYVMLQNQNIQDENSIIGSLGKSSIIVLTTLILGRGTDILLKGDMVQKGAVALISSTYGNRRVDRQVTGRVGRFGQTGYYEFFTCLDDPVFNGIYNFIRDKYKNMQDSTFYSKKAQNALNKLLTRQIKNNESKDYLQRLNMYVIESIIEKQKEAVFSRYRQVVKGSNTVRFFGSFIDKRLNQHNREQIINKLEQLGDGIANSLINQIIDLVMLDEWNLYYSSLKLLKAECSYSNHLRLLPWQYFLQKSNSYYNKLIEVINNRIIELFLDAGIVKEQNAGIFIPDKESSIV